jgi:hypothetical protein
LAEELGTRDVLAQVDKRLVNVEGDIRAIRQELPLIRSEIRSEISGVRAEVTSLSRWMIGLMLTLWLSTITSIWLKP